MLKSASSFFSTLRVSRPGILEVRDIFQHLDFNNKIQYTSPPPLHVVSYECGTSGLMLITLLT